MRTATVYNFLLEANIMASLAIVLMFFVRKCFRKKLGSRVLALVWILVAIRLLCPLSLPNPLINDIRSPFAPDPAIRPIAGQIKVRVEDFTQAVQRQFPYASSVERTLDEVRESQYNGMFAIHLMQLYLTGVFLTAGWFLWSNLRFRRRLKSDRVDALSGDLLSQYHALCQKRGIKPLPVFYVDPLPSACLVGVFRPYIALPLSAKPQEALLILTHEICHYRALDHIGNLIRLLCCTLHWFNPLVWAAAHMYATDTELACDERVTASMQDEERKAYARVLVLAAARRNAPGVAVLATGMTMTGRRLKKRVEQILHDSKLHRGLALVFLLLASMLLVGAFATGEYNPVLLSHNDIPSSVQAPDFPSSANEQSLIDYTVSLCRNEYFHTDLSSAEWTVEQHAGGWKLLADLPKESITIQYLPNGRLASFYRDRKSTGPILPEDLRIADPSDFDSLLSGYCLSFMDRMLPGLSGTIEAFSNASQWKIDGVIQGALYGETFIFQDTCKNGVYLNLEFDPVVRIHSFRLEPTLIQYLWKNGMAPLASSYTETLGGFSVDPSLTNREGSAYTLHVPEGCMSAEDALSCAVSYIRSTYGETDDSLRRFELRYGLNTEGEPYRWRFLFDSGFLGNTYIDQYDIAVDAQTGEVLECWGIDQGNG